MTDKCNVKKLTLGSSPYGGVDNIGNVAIIGWGCAMVGVGKAILGMLRFKAPLWHIGGDGTVDGSKPLKASTLCCSSINEFMARRIVEFRGPLSCCTAAIRQKTVYCTLFCLGIFDEPYRLCSCRRLCTVAIDMLCIGSYGLCRLDTPLGTCTCIVGSCGWIVWRNRRIRRKRKCCNVCPMKSRRTLYMVCPVYDLKNQYSLIKYCSIIVCVVA